MAKIPKPESFRVYSEVAEMVITGSLSNGRLEKKVKAILDWLVTECGADSIVRPPRALWKYFILCEDNGRERDAYELRFIVNNPNAIRKALSSLE